MKSRDLRLTVSCFLARDGVLVEGGESGVDGTFKQSYMNPLWSVIHSLNIDVLNGESYFLGRNRLTHGCKHGENRTVDT